MKFLLSLLMMILATPGMADEQKMLDQLQKKLSDPLLKQQSIQAGNERAFICKYCHGADGNSLKNTIPNLAAQNPVYLIRQFEQFARLERINKTMNQVAQLLTDEEKVNIALFYSSQPVKAQTPYRPELVEQGKKLYSYKCFFCHGEQGYGKEDTPYIAGQPSEYVKRTLSSYRSVLNKRAESTMSSIARTLDREEIEALTAYLTSIK